eukprot:GHVS01095444.1.p1 GENE.GHVS01095444.1~~GHVS01095444.1.p1  ORF type:complete len:228 (-),score=21.92 GHVS01095444.1:253-936(-)
MRSSLLLRELSAVNWSVVISLCTFCLTAWYYVNILMLTRHLQQANTLSLFHSEYSSTKILEAFEVVEDFLEMAVEAIPESGASSNSRHRAEMFWELRKKRDERGRLLERARRRLVHWFSRLQHFYEFGFLTKDYLVRFPGAERAQHFIDLVEPLEYVSRTSTGRQPSLVFDFLREIYSLGPQKDYELPKTSFPVYGYSQQGEPINEEGGKPLPPRSVAWTSIEGGDL